LPIADTGSVGTPIYNYFDCLVRNQGGVIAIVLFQPIGVAVADLTISTGGRKPQNPIAQRETAGDGLPHV